MITSKPIKTLNPAYRKVKPGREAIKTFKEHLLKLPFVNDSNTLDKRFYAELLHIIGLTESRQGGKKLIG